MLDDRDLELSMDVRGPLRGNLLGVMELEVAQAAHAPHARSRRREVRHAMYYASERQNVSMNLNRSSNRVDEGGAADLMMNRQLCLTFD